MNLKRVLLIIRNIFLFFLLSSILAVVVYRFVPVYVTPLMVIRSVENTMEGESSGWHHQWVPLKEISKHLPIAVIASEDNRFLSHDGFDFKEIQKAKEENKTRKKPRGASTISQQTAKNVFLWPHSSWIRKGFEAYFTILIEFFWSKERIMEIYLNSIEMGKSIYGAEAVAQQHFHKSAKDLSREECALIAASLPNPRIYHSGKPSAYVKNRQQKILRLMKLMPAFPETDKKSVDKTTNKSVKSTGSRSSSKKKR